MPALAVAAAVLVVQSGVVSSGDAVTLRVAGPPPAAPLRTYLANSFGKTYPFVTIPRGHRAVTVRFPTLPADYYRPALRIRTDVVRGRGTLAVRAVPPAGFGALGTPGCNPASPRNISGTEFASTEVFGTATGAQLWALAASDPSGPTAHQDGVVGKPVKIIFRMTSYVPSVFYAVAPDGRRVQPDWMQSHSGSDWQRPGFEWGAGFHFDSPGCWQIHAGSWPAQGDIWLIVNP